MHTKPLRLYVKHLASRVSVLVRAFHGISLFRRKPEPLVGGMCKLIGFLCRPCATLQYRHFRHACISLCYFRERNGRAPDRPQHVDWSGVVWCRALQAADLIVATPEKWDGISRNWQTRGYVQKVGLLVIDEIHLLGGDRFASLFVVSKIPHTLKIPKP
jgi:hypothetical protein